MDNHTDNSNGLATELSDVKVEAKETMETPAMITDADRKADDVENTVSLVDARPNYKRKNQEGTQKSSKACNYRTLLCFTVILGIIIGVLIGLLIWKEVSARKTPQEIDIESLPPEVRFSGYFRTPEEQALFKANTTKFTDYAYVNKTVNTTYVCTTDCYPFGIPQKRKRSVSLGDQCCLTTTNYISPQTYNNVQQNTRTILHLADENMHQYFKVENCLQATGCQDCRCVQDMDVITAVYVEESDSHVTYGIDWFPVPGCCRCRNV